MDAALKLCIALDEAGELADNLTILTKEQWIKPHYDIENDELNDQGKKIGTTKNKTPSTLA